MMKPIGFIGMLLAVLTASQGCGLFEGEKCKEWLVEGRCGLKDQCVDCNVDSDCGGNPRVTRQAHCEYDEDCPQDQVCNKRGECVGPSFCSMEGQCEELPECVPEGSPECPQGQICVIDRCQHVCATDDDCLGGAGNCLQSGFCDFQRCEEDGCPLSWEPVPGTLACRLACPEGSVPGRCGLFGKCVQCVTDVDCREGGGGNTCFYDGTCMSVAVCTTDAQCQVGHYCIDNMCVLLCADDSECDSGSKCNGEYCYTAWCSQEGVCPEGWEFISGSLRCRYTGS
jgi:hypothetical protein